LITAFAPTAYAASGQGLTFLSALLDAAEWPQPWTPPLSKTRETNILLALRGIANAFQTTDTAAVALEWVQPVRIARYLEIHMLPTDACPTDTEEALTGPVYLFHEISTSSIGYRRLQVRRMVVLYCHQNSSIFLQFLLSIS
jgi:hypothetical protein